jgi:NADPH2:quinone reductase
MREAAALPLSTITAWEGLVDRARVQADQKVLILNTQRFSTADIDAAHAVVESGSLGKVVVEL